MGDIFDTSGITRCLSTLSIDEPTSPLNERYLVRDWGIWH